MKQVDLVHDNKKGTLILHQSITQSGNIPVQKFRLAQIKIRIQHQHDAMCRGHALPCGLQHHFAQMPAHLIPGMMQARSIHKNNLRFRFGQYSDNTISGCLGTGRDYTYLLPDHGIQQRDLPAFGGPIRPPSRNGVPVVFRSLQNSM